MVLLLVRSPISDAGLSAHSLNCGELHRSWLNPFLFLWCLLKAYTVFERNRSKKITEDA